MLSIVRCQNLSLFTKSHLHKNFLYKKHTNIDTLKYFFKQRVENESNFNSFRSFPFKIYRKEADFWREQFLYG